MKNKTIRTILTLCLLAILMPASAQSDLQTGIAFERFGKAQNCKMVVLNDATLRGYKLKVYKSLTYKKIGASIAPYLNADRKKARKIREIVDDGKVTSGYYMLPPLPSVFFRALAAWLRAAITAVRVSCSCCRYLRATSTRFGMRS